MKRIITISFVLVIMIILFFQIKEFINSEPPSPSITVGGKSIPTKQGSYCWRGLTSGKCVDMISPPDIIKYHGIKPVIVSPEAPLKVQFRKKPNKDTLGANVWISDRETEDANMKGNLLIAPKEKGIYVYDVYARWNRGSASFVFTIEVQ